MIQRGDILLLPYPFTDLTGVKVRPALVISSDSFNKLSQDAVFSFITTKGYKGPFELRLNETDASFEATGLKGASTFRLSKIMCLEQALVRRRLGHADGLLMKNVDAGLKCLLELS